MEWNDQPWLPDVLRRALTDYLTTVIERGDLFGPMVPHLTRLCARTSHDRIVDLCAGAGGPWLRLQPALTTALGKPVRVTLTDLHPNRVAFARIAAATGGVVGGATDPIDARAVSPRLVGLRTMFDGFHHLPPDDARAVLADAHRSRQPIAIVEGTRRRLTAVIAMLLVPLMVLAVTPLIRPFSWARLLLTYLLPIVPLLVFWDGVVSCLRGYRPAELGALTAGLDDRYEWEVGEYRRHGAVVTYLLGSPQA
jgi:hypothetical protein